jgi:hypothetical protein
VEEETATRDKMNVCMAFKVNGARCTRASAVSNVDIVIPNHLHLCRMHQGTYATRVQNNQGQHHVAGRCLVHGRAWCPNPATETGKCTDHIQREAQTAALRAARLRAEQLNHDAYNFFWNRDPRPTWQQVARELYRPVGALPAVLNHPEIGAMELVRNYYRRTHTPQEPTYWNGGRMFVFDYIFWLQGRLIGNVEPIAANYHIPPPGVLAPPPAIARTNTLAAIARDSQNVHRAVVSEQTNRSTELLLATPDVPEHCRAHELLAVAWLNHRIATWKHVVRTVEDMIYWRDKATCRTENDRLYRRVLHGLYMRIHRMPDTETRKELWRRFYEECSEAVGQCCEGHISRLCNVLVGFDDAFKPPIPVGELLQARMSAISEMEVSLDVKVKLANEFFIEHKVPDDQRAAWIEAF